MKQPPQGSRFEYKEFPRSEYLRAVSVRLENEAGYYIDLISANPHPSGAGTGFWSGVRIIMPVVEAVAGVNDMVITDFMGQYLNIPMPVLTWAMFRHALIHNDQLQHAKYDGRTINWSISLTLGTGHIMQHDQIHIDIKTLYDDMQTYLTGEIAKNDQTPVKVAVGFEYYQPPVAVLAELRRLGGA